MRERLLLRGGYVLSMDDEIGELPGGDVLVEDGRIAAVAPAIEADGAERLDVSGHVVMPGFVDTHRHRWQAPFRWRLRRLDARGLLPRHPDDHR